MGGSVPFVDSKARFVRIAPAVVVVVKVFHKPRVSVHADVHFIWFTVSICIKPSSGVEWEIIWPSQTIERSQASASDVIRLAHRTAHRCRNLCLRCNPSTRLVRIVHLKQTIKLSGDLLQSGSSSSMMPSLSSSSS